jgi:serine/threonine protein kinase
VTCEATRAPGAAVSAVAPERAAVKIISKSRLASAGDVAAIRREAAVMTAITPHPNIVSLFGAFEDDAAVYLVQTLCSGGELFTRIAAAGAYAEADAASTVRDIMKALAHAHLKARAGLHRCLRARSNARERGCAGRRVPGREA